MNRLMFGLGGYGTNYFMAYFMAPADCGEGGGGAGGGAHPVFAGFFGRMNAD